MLTRSFRKFYQSSAKLCTCHILNNKNSFENEPEIKSSGKELGDMSSKYKVFQEHDSEIILDVYEERLKYSDLLEDEEPDDNLFAGLNLESKRKILF